MVRIYVEGGGAGEAQKQSCREGFTKLLAKAGFKGRMPRVVACGGRDAAFDKFKIALQELAVGDAIILLVDSEAPIEDGQSPWEHLRNRDRWDRPAGATDAQVQFMVTCMETWLVADREALGAFLGGDFNVRMLPPLYDLERRLPNEIQEALRRASQACARDRRYEKGRRSFQILASLNPGMLQQLPHFAKFIEALNAVC